MRINLLALILTIGTSSLFAQTESEIKHSSAFYWGEGEGATIDEADKIALAAVSRSISVAVDATSGRDNRTTMENGRAVSQTQVTTNSVVARSSATFTNIEMRVLQESPTFKVIRWIPRAEIQRQLDGRKAKVDEFSKLAHKALANRKVADALRYYYWSYALLMSLPHHAEVQIEDEEQNIKQAESWLPDRINSIFKRVKSSVVRKIPDELNAYEVAFTIDGQAVDNLQYTYFDGSEWSPIYEAIDGTSMVELRPSAKPSHLQLKYEYRFEAESQCDDEVHKILEEQKNLVFGRNFVNVPMETKGEEARKAAEAVDEVKTASTQMTEKMPAVSTDEATTCEEKMETVISATRTGKKEEIRPLCTDEGYDTYNRLVGYGKGNIVGTPSLSYTRSGDEIISRSVPMQFTFSGKRKIMENVVYTFDNQGKIDNVAFGLSRVAAKSLLGKEGSTFTSDARQVIENFLETFKTAYALKRIDYLEKVFADDALIITGKKVAKVEGNPENGYSSNHYVKLTRQSKAEYIANLRRIFRSREFVNIKFADSEIKKMGKGGEIYSIQIRQDYFSNNYGDSGYLFLLVDVNDPKNPIIHVRAWQEEPDPEWGIIGPEMF